MAFFILKYLGLLTYRETYGEKIGILVLLLSKKAIVKMIHFNFTLCTLTPNSKLISTLKTFNKHQLA